MKNKMLVFDLDGTCITDDYRITKNLNELIKKLTQNNRICIATGRSLSDAYRYYRELNIDSEIICYNGAFLYAPKENEVILNKYMGEHASILTYLREKITAMDIDNIIVSKGISTYRLGDSNGYLCDMMYDRELPNNIISIDAMISKLDGVHRIIISVSPVWRKCLMKEIEEYFRQIIVYSWRGRDDIIDICIGGVDKWDAIRYLADRRNIKVQDIIAFGDSDNDVKMIKNAGTGICLINGSQAAKSVADQVTKNDNNSDGVYKHLLEMIGKEL